MRVTNNKTEEDDSLSAAMALAQDRVRELLQRSFTQLPVAGDLPRLCNRMQVFVREEEDTPCIFLKEGREGEKRGVEDTAHSTTQRTKQEREGKMVYCTDTPRRENLCKLLSVLSDVLEPEMKREVVHQFEQYFPPSAEVLPLNYLYLFWFFLTHGLCR